MKHKFLLLGGKPIGSLDILQYARSQGAYVIVCDYLPASESPAKQMADEIWDLSTADVDKIVEKARNAGVTAVFTGVHEFNLAKCSEICERLGLPCYTTRELWDRAANKRYYKDVWKACGVPVIPEYSISTENLDASIVYPILLKPVDGSGAYGLEICRSEQDVKAKMADALKHSESGRLLAERYIEEKEEITAVYIVKDGKPLLASVADRIVKHLAEGIIPLPVGYDWPSKYLGLYERLVDSAMKKSLSKMGIENGMVFVQAIVKDNEIFPYDMGYRISGTQEHLILEAVCGYNPLKMLTDYSLGNGFGDENLEAAVNPDFIQSACNITFLARPGKIGRFEGLDAAENIDGVIRVIKNHLEGETIQQSAKGTLNQIVLRVFGVVPNREQLEELKRKVRSLVRVYDDKGEDMLEKWI